jgi:DNA-binding NarL/FixJ family response regulator
MAEHERAAVVIVEDDPAFRARFEQILASAAGYDVLAAVGSVAEGIDVVRGAAVDLLVVDLGLPDGDGIAVIREVTERQPACAVMVVTVFGDEEHVVSAIEAGASGYLLKDSDPADFTAAVRDLLDGGSPVSPMVARLVLERLRKPAERRPFEPEGEDPVRLSEREAEILTLVAKGFSFGDICRLLAITNNTVKTHVNRIYRKLAVHSRGQAVYEAARLGLIEF